MNSESAYTKFLEDSLKNGFVPFLSDNYGENALNILSNMNHIIKSVYKNIRIRDFKSITFLSNTNNELIKFDSGPNPIEVFNVDTFTTINADNILIQVVNEKIYYYLDWKINIDSYRDYSIIYSLNNCRELFYGKIDEIALPVLPDSESYFQFQTYKDLERALEDYYIKRVKHSSCPYLRNVWHDSNRILFVEAPEEIMQESMYDFLSISLRDNPEVMPEQNVDRSHPVDIKVTWKYSSHVALIEVKWLGKSLTSGTGNLVSRTDVDARNGADQLAEYLNSNQQFATTKIVSGYLTVFDGRRRRTNNQSRTISRVNGEFYRNKEINFTVKHEEVRKDFERPRRFFMEPIIL
jgi:hypothetical protein